MNLWNAKADGTKVVSPIAGCITKDGMVGGTTTTTTKVGCRKTDSTKVSSIITKDGNYQNLGKFELQMNLDVNCKNQKMLISWPIP